MLTSELPKAQRICYFIKQAPASVPPRLLREHREACRDALAPVLDIPREAVRVDCQTRIDGEFQLTVYERGSRTSVVLMVCAARALLPLHREFIADLNWSRFSLAEWSPWQQTAIDDNTRVLNDLKTGMCLGMSAKQRRWCMQVADNNSLPPVQLAALGDAELAHVVLQSQALFHPKL